MRKTKIIATLGPASSDEAIVSRLIKAGVDVFRLNFSHGSRDEHKSSIEMIKKISKEKGKHVAILQDLQGPKIRVGKIENGSMEIRDGEEVEIIVQNAQGKYKAKKKENGKLKTKNRKQNERKITNFKSKNISDCFTAHSPCNNRKESKVIPTTYRHLPKEVKVGGKILLDDGKLELKAINKGENFVKCKVIKGGILKENKGINLPDSCLSIESFTEKDKEDLEFGINAGIDYVAVSFVRSEDDIIKVKNFTQKRGVEIPIIAKIERPEAIECFDKILEQSYGIMVARGDLGIEMPTEKVPILQKWLVKKTNEVGKIVIIATQMLETMISSPQPTRAEVSDVANAVFDGTDAVMLSGETATGKYPVESVKIMNKIIEEVEKELLKKGFERKIKVRTEDSTLAIAHSAYYCAKDLNAKAIVAFTHTGATPLLISGYNPPCRIIGMTPSERTARRMSLYWGVEACITPLIKNTDEMIKNLEKIIIKNKFAKKGDFVIIISGSPIEKSGTTNLMKIHKIGLRY